MSEVIAIAKAVRVAREERTSLRITGAGTWMNAGRPVDARALLATRALNRVIAYEPGDLTITVGAGASLQEIAAATAANGQWLALDPFGDGSGTIGATIATASSGPLASAFGTPRDQILGCEFVSGRGEIVRAGGRVVKNVAGFDLVRLLTGAWGTLGVITEVTMRLRALPETELTFAVDCDASSAWHWLRASEITPYAAEMLSPAVARTLGLGERQTLLLRVGGNAALVETARRSAAALGELREVDASIWKQLAVSEPPDAAVVRFSVMPSRVPELWNRVAPLIDGASGFSHATLQRGVVRCVVPAGESTGALLQSVRGDATCIGERLPAALWNTVATPAPNAILAARVQQAFDADRVLNRGIMGA